MAHRRKASISGSTAPTLIGAEFTGQVYYDTLNNLSYISRSKTVGDWAVLGNGDMTKSVYDINLNNITDKSEELDDGAGNVVTALEIRNHLDNLSVFGSEFQFGESLGVSITTSTNFQNKLDFNTTNLPTGKYKVELYYGWNHDRTNNDFESNLALDNNFNLNNMILTHRQEPKDSGGSGSGIYVSTRTNQLYGFNGFRILDLSGIHNFKLRYRTSNNGDESSIWSVTLIIYRVL